MRAFINVFLGSLLLLFTFKILGPGLESFVGGWLIGRGLYQFMLAFINED